MKGPACSVEPRKLDKKMSTIDGKLRLTNVRLSFPQLFRPKSWQQGQEPSYSANFILSKTDDAEQILAIRQKMTELARERWGAAIPKGIKLCLRDGGEEGKTDVDGYGPTVMFLSTSSRKKIPLVDRNLAPLTEDDGKLYAGCYVNASMRFWVQDNEFGKRVNAQLNAVQFALDGEAFGEAPVKVEEVFDNLGEDADTPQPNAASGDEGGGLLG